jgi:hypothetical protein
MALANTLLDVTAFCQEFFSVDHLDMSRDEQSMYPSERIGSVDVPMKPTTVRFDEPTLIGAQRAAKKAEMSLSEFIRQAVAVRCAWLTALEAVEAGGDPGALTETDPLIHALRSIEREKPPPKAGANKAEPA